MRLRIVGALLVVLLSQTSFPVQQQCKTQIDDQDQFTQSLGNAPELPATPSQIRYLADQVGSCVLVSRLEHEHEMLLIEPSRLLKYNDHPVMIFNVFNVTHVAILAEYDRDGKLRRVSIY